MQIGKIIPCPWHNPLTPPNTTGVHFLSESWSNAGLMNAGQIQTTRMGSWDLVAKPSPITRGSQSNFHCGLPGFGPSLSKSREMRRVGCEGIQAKIPLAICNQPLQISQSYFLSCKIMNQPEYCKKKYLPCYKYEKYLRSRANADFTQSIFSFPRREGDCV